MGYMPRSPHKERDLRSYARSTQFRLILGALILIVVIGNGLIWLIFGADSARMALLCIGIGLAPVLLIAICLWLMSWIVRIADYD
jgi:hypothetical protein